MDEPTVSCKKCGLALAGQSPRGLCPACLLETSLHLEDDDDPNVGGIDAAGRESLIMRRNR